MEFKQATGILSLSPFDGQGIHDLKRAKPFLFDVFLVVGAGPVGLTLAIDPTTSGIACRIIDQAPAYPIGTRGRGISLRTQEIFNDLDVLEPLLAYTEPLVPWRYSGQDNKLVREINLASNPVVLSPPHRSILMISQQHTEAVLRERLASFGMHVELDCQLTGFTQAADRVVAKVIQAEGI